MFDIVFETLDFDFHIDADADVCAQFAHIAQWIRVILLISIDQFDIFFSYNAFTARIISFQLFANYWSYSHCIKQPVLGWCIDVFGRLVCWSDLIENLFALDMFGLFIFFSDILYVLQAT